MPVDYDIYDPANADRLYNDFYGGSPGFVARGGGGAGGRDAIAAAVMAQQAQQQQQQQQQLAALPPQGDGGGGGFGLYDLFYAGSPGFTPGRGPGYGSNPWAPGYPRRPGDGGDGDGSIDVPGTIGSVDDYYQGHPGPAEPQSFPGDVAPTPDPTPGTPPFGGEVPFGGQVGFDLNPTYDTSNPYGTVSSSPTVDNTPVGPPAGTMGLGPGFGVDIQMMGPTYGPQGALQDNPLTASASTTGYGPSTDYASALAAELGYGSVAEMFDAVNSGAFGGDELVGGGGGSYSEVEDPYGDADYDAGGFDDDYGGDDEE